MQRYDLDIGPRDAMAKIGEVLDAQDGMPKGIDRKVIHQIDETILQATDH